MSNSKSKYIETPYLINKVAICYLDGSIYRKVEFILVYKHSYKTNVPSKITNTKCIPYI